MARMPRLSKPAFDLSALFLIWVGTAVITFGGIPQLIDHGFAFGDSGFGDAAFGHSYSADDLSAQGHYYEWAGVGFVVITLGMLLQAIEPYAAFRGPARTHGASVER